MDAFLKYFYQDMGLILKALVDIFISIFNFLNVLLNYPMRMKIIKSYSPDFGVGDWVLLGISNLLLLAVIVLAIVFIVRGMKKLFSFRVPAKENEKLKAEVAKLSREVFKLNYEKDKILAMKVSEMGMKPSDMLLSDGTEEDSLEDKAEQAQEKNESKKHPGFSSYRA
jgi:hypothetical protein